MKPTIKITGIGAAFPPISEGLEEVDRAVYALCKPSPALIHKLRALAQATRIKSRSVTIPFSSLAQAGPAPIRGIDELSAIFMKEGVALAVSAAHAAIKDAGISVDDITHVVSTTCTNSSNPGYDVLVARDLGLRPTVEKVLLHGVACTGGLAGLRLACTLCHAAAWRGRPVHVLVVACELTSLMGRYYLDRIDKEQDVPAGLVLYGDAASALVVSLDSSPPNCPAETGIFEVVTTTHMVFPDTEDLIQFLVTPHGWKECISPAFPEMSRSSIPVMYNQLLGTLPDITLSRLPPSPSGFDWPIPASYILLNQIKKALGIDRDNFKASWELHEGHANTSSSSFGCALDISRRIENREWLISVGFAAGIAGEAVLLRRIATPKPVRAVL
ncbi:thiolase-like protein [Mycena latifolia]|nr:thiolase-like protein [Mycena latifolia]